ncbi:MAG: HAMP domain-containing histidine kinase [Nocardioidaceae bacterium]|nr:HAMP domain-containing histidine kinase [Nocardioidaceae bacterium]MCL2614106.1 HAMP domain-containing histidine kinase [Nocardioidaceae bacterium]
MLTAGDLGLIFFTTLACTAVVMLVAVGVSRLNRHGTLAFHLATMLAAALIGVAGSTWAVAREMLFPAHELTVLLWILGAAILMSLAGVWFVSVAGRRAAAALQASLSRVARGEVVRPAAGWKEFAELSAQLATTSEQLAAARRHLEQVDADRREFFAWISHDLRTPLAGMRVLAEALEDGPADPTGYVRQMQAQVDNMARLVDDLFELSRLRSGGFRLTCESVALLDIVSDAVADVRELARARDVRITHTGIEGHLLWADPHEFSRVVVNLLTNAIRHSPIGSTVVVAARREADGRLLMSVLDRGAGVAPEDLGRMFEVGWRANDARTAPAGRQATGGGGLGLAIVRGIVEAHGGEVTAEHAPEGFELCVTMPAPA